MKVYVIRWYDNELRSGVHKVFSSREKAEEYLSYIGTGPFDYGYYLLRYIHEYEVE